MAAGIGECPRVPEAFVQQRVPMRTEIFLDAGRARLFLTEMQDAKRHVAAVYSHCCPNVTAQAFSTRDGESGKRWISNRPSLKAGEPMVRFDPSAKDRCK